MHSPLWFSDSDPNYRRIEQLLRPRRNVMVFGGQQRTVGAVYFAPVGGHNGVSQLLPQRPLGVPAAGA
jgi:hypothetical protein